MNNLFQFKPITLQAAKLSKICRNIVIQGSSKSALILPPTDSGSLGDQAMVTAVVSTLKSRGYKKVTLIAYDSEEDCKSFYDYPDVIKFKGNADFVQKAFHYTDFYCLGADVMDGYYSESRSLFRAKLAYLSDKMGLTAAILGFSFNKNPKPATIEALSSLPKTVTLYARDPISHERLLDSVKGPSIKLTADLAFLLKPDESSSASQKVYEWAKKQKEQNRLIIGLNINCKISEVWGAGKDQSLIQMFKEVMTDLYHHYSASFLLMPHDFRGKTGILSDVEFCKEIESILPQEILQNTFSMPLPCRASDIKYACGQADFVLTGRMHLAIAALGQGTPTACITYQGKFEGLFKHLSLNHMTFDPENGLSKDRILGFINPLITERDRISREIKLSLPNVKKMSLENLEISLRGQ